MIVQTLSAMTVLAAGAAHAQCGSAQTQCGSHETQASVQITLASHAPSKDIVQTAVEAGSFNTLAAALKAAGLIEALQGDGPFTVFAPTDEAFANLPAGTVETLLKPENVDTLRSILLYHVVPGELDAATVVSSSNATTVNGQRVDFSVGDGAKIDNANIVATDIQASNGIIHVIDRVILPSDKDIIDTAVEAGSFSTLAAAVKTAGLVKTLKGEGPFTVFAPTDEAFAKLPAGTVNDLLKKKNRARLTEILTYHVVPGRVFADQAVAARSAETVQGDEIRFSFRNGQLFVNDSGIELTDLDTSNGVIHVIDSVLIPE